MAAGLASLCGCTALQNRENTVQMVNSIEQIRREQVLRNISIAIDDHNMVPVQIVLGTGQASVMESASPTLKLPDLNFSKSTKELDAQATVNWTSQWQMAPVINAIDLRNLRDLYVLVASTDDEFAYLAKYLNRHRELRSHCPTQDAIIFEVGYSKALVSLGPGATPDRALALLKGANHACASGVKTGTDKSKDGASGGPNGAPEPGVGPGPSPAPAPGPEAPAADRPKVSVSAVSSDEQSGSVLLSISPAGGGGGGESIALNAKTPAQTATWYDGLYIIELGDSIGCKLYQEQTLNRMEEIAFSPAGAEQQRELEESTLPFKRWLYWKRAGDQNWAPNGPPANDDSVSHLGHYGRWDLGTTSKACFDDFVILVEGATPSAAAASTNGPKNSITSQ